MGLIEFHAAETMVPCPKCAAADMAADGNDELRMTDCDLCHETRLVSTSARIQWLLSEHPYQ